MLTVGAALCLALVTAAGAAACGGGDRPGAPGKAAQEAAQQTPEGHKTTHSAPPAAPLRAGERFQFLSMAQPYTPKPPAGSTDEYRCFLVDPHVDSTS